MRNYIVAFGVLFSLVACASKSTSLHEEQARRTLLNKGSVPPSKPSQEQESSTKRQSSEENEGSETILTYFYMLYPKGSEKPVDGLEFTERAVTNGYLKVTGNMEGYFLYDLFKGHSKDYVIEQSTECGPECEQKFRVHIFSGGKLVKSQTFETMYPKNRVDIHVSKMKSLLPRGHSQENLQPWIRLPKKGTSLELLILEQNPGATTGEVKAYKIGNLPWNGRTFDFHPLNSRTPSLIHISDVQ